MRFISTEVWLIQTIVDLLSYILHLDTWVSKLASNLSKLSIPYLLLRQYLASIKQALVIFEPSLLEVPSSMYPGYYSRCLEHGPQNAVRIEAPEAVSLAMAPLLTSSMNIG